VPVIEYQLASPDMLNRFFALCRDGHDVLYVTEGQPGAEQPFVFFASKPVEPFITACPRSQTESNPAYDLIASPSGMALGSIRRLDGDYWTHDPRLPAHFEVTDNSDDVRYLWKEEELYNPVYRFPSELRLLVSIAGGPGVGRAECKLSHRKLLVHREGGLWLGFDTSPLSLNMPLQLAVFGFILTMALPCRLSLWPPTAPASIWGHDYLHPPQPD